MAGMAVARQPPVEVLNIVVLRPVRVTPVGDHKSPVPRYIPQRTGVRCRCHLNLHCPLNFHNLSLNDSALYLHNLGLDDRPFDHLRVDDRCRVTTAAGDHDRRHGQRNCGRNRKHQPLMQFHLFPPKLVFGRAKSRKSTT